MSDPTTAANWWLLRVARQLSRLNAANSKSRKVFSRHAGARFARFSGRLDLFADFFDGSTFAGGPARGL